MHSFCVLPALLFGIRVFGVVLPAENPAKVTATPHLEARQDGLITDLGAGCTSPSSGLPEVCLASFPPYTPATAPATPTTTSTAAGPTISCVQQNEDPDNGILQQGCICSQGTTTETLPILATNVLPDSSCAYTNFATSTIAVTQNWGSPFTNTQICQACTPTTDFGAASCTSLPNCFPQTPSATIQIGSSPVLVGTLTSAALFSSISSAIATLCPSTATACDGDTKITIPDITYVEDDSLAYDGELLVQIDSSGYNDSSTLNALIGMAAQSFASSATGGNCADVDYTAEIAKRGDHPQPTPEKINLCNAGHFASPQYYSQYWRDAAKPGPQDYLSVEITFGAGPGGALLCEFIEALAELVETAFTPELLGPEQVADEEFAIGCEEAMSLAGN